MTQKKYLKTRDLCKLFDVSIQAVYEWRKQGMPYIGSGKLIFYIEEDVVNWLETRDSQAKVREVIEKIYPKK